MVETKKLPLKVMFANRKTLEKLYGSLYANYVSSLSIIIKITKDFRNPVKSVSNV